MRYYEFVHNLGIHSWDIAGTDRCSYTGCHDPGTSPESEETIK